MYALVNEIFSSVQGEGPWLGQRQVFVRFVGCDIACRYCDTPEPTVPGMREDTLACRAQKNASSFAFEEVSGKMSGGSLSICLSRSFLPGPSRPVVSVTGGEPLLHRAFLELWLPMLKKSSSIYLETNGLQESAMAALRQHVDVISMDFKLPSATGLRPFWEDHRRFLEAAGAGHAPR